MTISIKLLESNQEIDKKIKLALSEYINNVLRKKSSLIADRIKKLIPAWIKSQPEMTSLLSRSTSSLVGQFGITSDTSYIVQSIANSVSENTVIKTKPYNSNLKAGGLDLYIQPINFSNLLSLPEGHTVYKDGDLHWLDWLLTRGDQIIIVGYEYNPQTGIGRSNLGNMKAGNSFRIPPQFSGTQENNFVTRALSGKEQEQAIAKIFQEVLGDL